jgi:hypothetical protein
MSNIELFISHSHDDSFLVGLFSETIKKCLNVPSGKVRRTSAQAEGLSPGKLLLDTIRNDIETAKVVVTVATPASIHSNWFMLELGVAWGMNKTIVPVSAGVAEDDLPLLLKERAIGQLASVDAITSIVQILHDKLNWSLRAQNFHDILKPMTKAVTEMYPPENEMPFEEKRERIGDTQCRIVDSIEASDEPVEQAKLIKDFSNVKTDLYYRLETLRLLGFLTREVSGYRNHVPIYRWTLSRTYRESRMD